LCLAAVLLLPGCTSSVQSAPIFSEPIPFESDAGSQGAEPTLINYRGRGLYAVALTPAGAALWRESSNHHALQLLTYLDRGLGRSVDVDFAVGGTANIPEAIWVADQIEGKGIAILRSEDGGRTFRLLSMLDRGYDRPWLLRALNSIYLFDSSDRPPRIHVSLSTDEGTSFKDIAVLQPGAEPGATVETVLVGRPICATYGIAAPVVITSTSPAGRTTQHLDLALVQPFIGCPSSSLSGPLQGQLVPVAGGGPGSFQGFPSIAAPDRTMALAYSGRRDDAKRHVWLAEAEVGDVFASASPAHSGQVSWTLTQRLDQGKGEAVFPALQNGFCVSSSWLQSDGQKPPTWWLMFGYQADCRQSAGLGMVGSPPREEHLTITSPLAAPVHRGDICLGGEQCLFHRSLLDFMSLIGIGTPALTEHCTVDLVAMAYADDVKGGAPRLFALRQINGPCLRSGSGG
jgi:hypothetical protein